MSQIPVLSLNGIRDSTTGEKVLEVKDEAILLKKGLILEAAHGDISKGSFTSEE